MKLLFISLIFLFCSPMLAADPCETMLKDGSWDVKAGVLNIDKAIKAKCNLNQNKKCTAMWFAEPMPALSCAILYIDGYPQVGKKIIDGGADLNAADAKGATPLMYAARFDSVNLEKSYTRMLIDAGADKLAKDKKGNDVISYAKVNLSSRIQLIVDDFSKLNLCEQGFKTLSDYRHIADNHKYTKDERDYPEVKKKWDAMRAQLKVYGTSPEGFDKKCGKKKEKPGIPSLEKAGAK